MAVPDNNLNTNNRFAQVLQSLKDLMFKMSHTSVLSKRNGLLLYEYNLCDIQSI